MNKPAKRREFHEVSVDTKQIDPGQIDPGEQARGVESEIGAGGKIIQVQIFIDHSIQFLLSPFQLLILHLKLNLSDFEFFDQLKDPVRSFQSARREVFQEFLRQMTELALSVLLVAVVSHHHFLVQ